MKAVEFIPPLSDLTEQALVVFCGWSWWAFPWRVDDEEIIVRSLRGPTFPSPEWRAWGNKQTYFGLANGDEPVMEICHQTTCPPFPHEIMSQVEAEIEKRGIHREYAKKLRSITSGPISDIHLIMWNVATPSIENRMMAALEAERKAAQ